MSPALNGSTALQCFECGNAVEMRNTIMLDFYLGLPCGITVFEVQWASSLSLTHNMYPIHDMHVPNAQYAQYLGSKPLRL